MGRTTLVITASMTARRDVVKLTYAWVTAQFLIKATKNAVRWMGKKSLPR